jgi:hypothetical protein
MTTRQYARLVAEWIAGIGLDPHIFATHSLRRTKATLIYRTSSGCGCSRKSWSIFSQMLSRRKLDADHRIAPAGDADDPDRICGRLRPGRGASFVASLPHPLPAAQRTSIPRLRPSVQPNSASPCLNPESQAFGSGSFSSNAISTPTRRRPAGCCARTVSGHATALPSPAINSRRRISHPSGGFAPISFPLFQGVRFAMGVGSSCHRPWSSSFGLSEDAARLRCRRDEGRRRCPERIPARPCDGAPEKDRASSPLRVDGADAPGR